MSDSRERIARITLLLRIGLPAFIVLVAIHTRLNASGRIGNTAYIVWMVADPFIAVAIALGIGIAIDRAGSAFVSTVLAGGNIPYTPQFSQHDALVVRGQHDEAVALYHEHIAANPTDLDARLRLAALLAGPAGRPADAERVFLEVRERAPTPRQTHILSNGLIDIYRAMNRRDDLLLELGRYARRFADTPGGVAAAEHLARLRAEQADRIG